MLISTTLAALVLAAAQPDPAAADRLVREGRREYRQGKMEKALGLYQQAIDGGASDGRLFYEAGKCLQKVQGNTAGGEMLSRAIPLLQAAVDATPPPRSPEPFYYLATIYLHELGRGVDGVPLAQQAVKLYEEGSFDELTDPDEQFRMGRLFEMANRKDEALGFYEKAIAGYDGSKDPDRNNLVIALQESAFALASGQEWARSANLYERLLELTTLAEKDRFSAAVVMLRADRFEAAEKALQGFTEDSLATEASYILRILERYEALDEPPLPAEPAVKDDSWLQGAILEAGAELGAIRSGEAKQAEEDRQKRIDEQRAEMEAASPSKKSKFGPPPEPIVLRSQGPVRPPSEERQAAERRFFGLMAEYVRRGNLVRNFALSAGLAQLIFR